MTMTDELDNSLEAPAQPSAEVVYQKLPHYIMWVFENIENHQCKRTQAPSLGAWGLLKSARGEGLEDADRAKAKMDFYKSFVPKALAILEKQGQVDEYEAGLAEMERRPIAELEKLIDEAVREAA